MRTGGNTRRACLTATRRWVIKMGSALLTADGRGLNTGCIQALTRNIACLRSQGYAIVLVTSGAVAAGVQRLGWQHRPPALHKQQAAAAVGQTSLIRTYETQFQHYGQQTAQILLTHGDLANRKRYLNARSTLRTLWQMGVVPIVNENDTVATEEIRFGDNDTLSALVANLVEAELLVILTDQTGLYDADPRHQPDARPIRAAAANDPRLDAMASAGSGTLGRGGMVTKIGAARYAAHSGATTVIASGRATDILQRIAGGETTGTLLWPETAPLAARKQWLASQLRVQGRLWLDEGAVSAVREAGRSVLPVGVLACQGCFARGEVVSCLNPGGREIARGLVNYGADEAQRILGQSSDRIKPLLGYVDEEELIHRDNLVLL